MSAHFSKMGDWILVYQQDADDAFSDLKDAQNIAIVIVLMGALCIITTAIILSKRIVDRIAVSDQEKEMMKPADY